MSQNARILTRLANGRPLTRLEAMFDLKVQNVTARITDLRRWYGVRIDTTIKKADDGAEYAEYSLSPEEAHFQSVRSARTLKVVDGKYVAII